ncbi:MAG: M28 family peptidase [Bacteroidetes bacterium]|nr:MAG: M28 family peptidase [Bacteroidota bacterium]
MRICRFLLVLFISLPTFKSFAQNELVSAELIDQHLKVLASDSLKGRKNFSPELFKAANYIEVEFAKAGLQPLTGFFDYYIPFNAGTFKTISRDLLKWNGQRLSQDHFFYFTGEKYPARQTLSDFRLIEIEGKLPDSILYTYWNETEPVLIWWKGNKDKSEKINSNKLLVPNLVPFSNVLLVSSKQKPEEVDISTDKDYTNNVMFNMVGLLRGKTKPSEIIIFSAHYDHIGVNKQLAADSIFNGANDNASGVASMLSLAAYYAARNDNERTLMFCAFAGEEIGLRGSYNLADILRPESIKAMINLEMLGKYTEGKPGEFFITGEKNSDLKKIMQESLNTPGHKILEEPAADNLFLRSDNYPFALKGVPAHSIMTSYDNDPCYHKPCDELIGLNPGVMSIVLKNIIAGCEKIISGEKTPKRVSGNF